MSVRETKLSLFSLINCLEALDESQPLSVSESNSLRIANEELHSIIQRKKPYGSSVQERDRS